MSIEAAETGRVSAGVQKALLLLAILAAVCFLPYFFKVPIAVSLSYVAGFNNRIAVLLLLAGAAGFAFFTRGEPARMDSQDGTLSVPVLLMSAGLILLACLMRAHVVPIGSRADEGAFFVNRMQMLAVGLKAFRAFDFPYGPLQLYPGFWIARVLHLTQPQGYVVWWTTEWVLGTAMMWAVVRGIDFPVRWRLWLYAVLFVAQAELLRTDGLNYTPFRNYMAAFLVFAAWSVWKRWRNAWWFALASVGAVGGAIACSMEQGVGVAVGLSSFVLLLALSRETKFPWLAVVLYAAGCGGCLALAARMGLFISFKAFTSGGFANPVLVTPLNCVVLFAYVMAGCILYRTLKVEGLNSVVVPMTLAGCGMLAAAMGRCDYEHVTAAMPAFVVGAAAICAMPAVRRLWLPLIVLTLIVSPMVSRAYVSRVVRIRVEKTASEALSPALTESSIAERPCDRTYYSPIFATPPAVRFHPECLEVGYYFGLVDIVTQATITQKIDEMRSRPGMPLLLLSAPLEEQFSPQNAEMDALYEQEQSFYVPRARNKALGYEEIIEYIRGHYVPGRLVQKGQLREWDPIKQ